ncbi:MAG: zinc ABC transporter substrate-binding protein [Chloroflexota bacterium]|nr:zinc ABC transporter substrate-binding protein [Chloroflexota bacterium]
MRLSLKMLLLAPLLAACGSGASAGSPAGSTGLSAASPAGRQTIAVVAAENTWGSIAGQLGGDRATVASIVSNPDTDPHDYEPTPANARTMALAKLAIVNGIGYDSWATKLLAANPASGRIVLNVGELVGAKEGGNPHRWYSPGDVHKVIDQITADYKRLSPANAAYFDAQRAAFLNEKLAAYDELIGGIKAKYAGTPVGASENIFSPLAEALGLKLLTPARFLDAISQGMEPNAGDKARIDAQIRNKEIEVYVYNLQNATPDVRAQVKAAKAQGIPVVTITETLSPAAATFQDWQVAQLQALRSALHEATGK